VHIILNNTGKKFNTEWIFRNVSYTFEDHGAYAVLGRNGSGKSTFLQVLAGNIVPTSGTIRYSHKAKDIQPELIFRHLSLVAPYQELIEEFTLNEMLKFHFSFKTLMPGFTIPKIIDMLGFASQKGKPIRLYSSGMKQRVKLIMAILSDTPLLFLDEPTMNLDAAGTEWYLGLISEFMNDRLVIVCSNLEQVETGFCTGKLFIEDYK
jgi:ABC-type multidrug transport system ATPase subunit